MEPRSGLAAYDRHRAFRRLHADPGHGRHPEGVRPRHRARAEHFRIHAKDVGGGFGVRNEIYPEFSALAFAARESLGRPVKWVGTRSESLLTDHHGRGRDLDRRACARCRRQLSRRADRLARRSGRVLLGCRDRSSTPPPRRPAWRQRLSHAGGLRLEPAGVHQCHAGRAAIAAPDGRTSPI